GASTFLAGMVSRTKDGFADLISKKDLPPSVMLVSLLIAFLLGAGHALTPGHGKTIVAAYLVGSRGTAKQAAFLGATVTFTHTIGVFAMGGIALFASQYILPEKLFPWLGVASGLMVVLIGGSLLRKRLDFALHGIIEHDHGHGGDHDATHDHDHPHTH